MTGNKKSLLIKLCTFSMCFFSLFSVGAAALAWFYAGRVVQSRESVEAKKDDLHAEYFVYKYSKNNTGTDLDESTEDETDLLSITNLTLNTYDTIFIAQNKYTPALVRIHVYGKDLPMVSGGESQNISVKITRNTEFIDEEVEEDDETLYKCITSVADFSLKEATNYSSFIRDDDLDEISNVETFFDSVVSSFKNSSETPTNFINPEQTNRKVNDVVITTSYSTVYQEGEINHCMLYLYIDYNKTLIENFTGTAATSLNANFLSAVDTILENDLLSIQVNIPEE